MTNATVLLMLSLPLLGSLEGACRQSDSESLDLAETIVSAALRLPQDSGAIAVVKHRLQTDSASVVALLPSTGFDVKSLSIDLSDGTVGTLQRAAEQLQGRPILAIVWAEGSSFGASIERYVIVRRQFLVTKAPRDTVVARLQRVANGQIEVVSLE